VTTLNDVDARLAAWAERLQRIDDSLLALEAEPIYQMLAGAAGKRARLEGVTRERAGPALDALTNLFESRQRLRDVFDRAKELRASMSAIAFWENDDKLRQIHQLLDGPSVHMGTQATPLAQRRLLDLGAQDVALSPEQVLAAMATAFEGARDTLLAVGEAWRTLEPALERMEREAVDLRALATSVGEIDAVRDALAGIARDLDAARTLLARDPLGATGNIEGALAPRIAEVRARIGSIAAHRERVTRGLALAAARRRALGELHRGAGCARRGPRQLRRRAHPGGDRGGPA
jgi:hypothetical protein